ncbi:MAG TPA: hypothetical protein VGD64_14985 [Acidisarcina sp.]
MTPASCRSGDCGFRMAVDAVPASNVVTPGLGRVAIASAEGTTDAAAQAINPRREKLFFTAVAFNSRQRSLFPKNDPDFESL